MIALRLIGFAFGIATLVWAARGRDRVSRGASILATALALALVGLGVWPNAANAILEFFAFRPGGGGRLIGLLIFSNLVLYLFVFTALQQGSRVERAVDELVRRLAKREFRRRHDADSAPICVVIPAYNEEENVASVLAGIPDHVLGLRTRVVVVVDGATDETEGVVTRLKKAAVSYTINRGGGSALKAGYELAIEDGAEIIVILDADGQHLPEEIPTLVKPIVDGAADFVNGSRVLGHYEWDSRLRALGVVVFNVLVSVLTLKRITDCSSGFRAVRADALRQLRLRQVQFYTSEMLIEALKKRLRVVEVPITIRPRRAGQSKKGGSVRYALGFTQSILQTWLR